MRNTDKNVVIIGMPGVGKSTVGKILANQLKYAFLDSDDVIEANESQTLAQIIACKGMAGFLAVEEQHVTGIECQKHVVATGGSVIYSDKIMAHFKENGFIVYLYAALDVLTARLGDLSERGVAINPGNSLEDLYNERTPLYETFCDVKVDCGNATPEQVVNLILCA